MGMAPMKTGGLECQEGVTTGVQCLPTVVWWNFRVMIGPFCPANSTGRCNTNVIDGGTETDADAAITH